MTNAMRLSLFSLLGLLVVFTGCASRKKTSRLDAMQAQIGVLTDEVARLDQSLQETKASAQPTEGRRGEAGPASYAVEGTSGPTYRTPSGFELPSRNIQQALKNAGYYTGNLDGKIGAATKDAVKAFQRDNGLRSDGVVGRQTWNKLKVYLSGTVK